MSALVVCSRLRFIPIAKRISSVLRCAKFRQYNSQHLQIRQKNCVKNLSQIRCVASTATATIQKTSKIDTLVYSLEANLRRFGRVSRNQLRDVLEEINREGVPSKQNFLLILRCFGWQLYDEHPDTRVKLAEQFWNKLEGNVSISTQDFNALLGVYLQNGHKFSPEEFLAKMEAKGATPNRVTFQRLIARYCDQGDIEGANKVLNHMKSVDLPINDNVFNSFITGHFKAGDPNSANEIVGIMAQSGLEPTGDTYSALMCGYAEMGDVEGIQRISLQAETESVLLRPHHYLDALVALVESGHEKDADVILMILSKKMVFIQDAVLYANRLLANGYDDVAYKLFLTMPKPVPLNEKEITTGRFFLRALAKYERPVDKVSEMVREMNEMKLNGDDLSEVLHMALSMKNTDYALEVMTKMKSEGLPVKTHYFWPAFCQYRDQQKADKIIDTVAALKQLTNVQEDMVYTLHHFVIPALVLLKENPEQFMPKLEAAGFTKAEVNFAYFINLLSKNKPEEALEFGKKKSMWIVFNALKIEILQLMKNGQLNWQLALELVELCARKTDSRAGLPQLSGDVLWTFLATTENKRDWNAVEELLDTMVLKGLMISQNEIQPHFLKNAPGNIIEKFESLHKDLKEKGRPTTLSEKSMDELREVVDADTQNMYAKRLLLIKACSVGNVEEAEKLKADLDQQGFVYPPIVVRQLAYLYATFTKDLEKAMMYFNQLESEYPTFTYYARVVLSIASLKLEQGNTEEAVSMLEEYGDKCFLTKSGDESNETFQFKHQCGQLVKTAVKHDVDSALLIMDALFDHGFIKKGAWEVCDAYLDGLIELDDTEILLANLTKLFVKNQGLPNVHGVLCLLIKKEDPEKLQKVVDMATERHGEMNVLHYLIAAFVDCEDLKKARKILETPGLRARMPRLLFACNHFIKNNKITALENLVSITRDMFDINRDHMLFHLMRGYVFNRDYDKALAVLDQYEEENVHVSDHTLLYLANEFTKAEKKLPDHVQERVKPLQKAQSMKSPEPVKRRQAAVSPKTQSMKRREPVQKRQDAISLSPLETEACQFIAKEDFENFDALRKKSDKEVSLVNIFKALISQKKYVDMKNLVRHIKKEGDLESLMLIKNEIKLPETVKLLVNSHVFHWYVERDQFEEGLQHLRDSIEDLKSYINNYSIKDLGTKSPKHFSEVEEMVIQLAEKEMNYRPLSVFWAYYFLEGSKRADELLEKYPDMAKYLNFSYTSNKASNEGRMDLLKSLVDLQKQLGLKHLPVVYSSLIGACCTNNDLKSAQETVKQLEEDGLQVASLRQNAVIRLNKLFTDNKIPITWEMTPKRNESSSSSDSSSSDDEPKK